MRSFYLLLPFLCFFIHNSTAQVDSIFDKSKPLRIVVKSTLPFIFEEDGEINGFAIELWDRIADELDVDYTISKVNSMPKLITTVQDNNADIGIGSVSITEEREKIVDFTQPYMESGLRLLKRVDSENSSFSTIRHLFSGEIFLAILIIFLLILFISHLLWIVERKINSKSFPVDYRIGIKESIWWSLSTLISGGCENKAPIGFAGRLVAITWMLGGIGLTSFITATLASALTIGSLNNSVNSLSDLKATNLGTIEGSSAEIFLKKSGYNMIGFKDLNEAVVGLESKKISAIVFDSPVLLYYNSIHQGKNLEIAGAVFEKQDYGFALPLGSPLRKEVNSVILKLKFSGFIDDLKEKWFPSEEVE
jgi:polar amino acid transport system substrate-binding protein